MLAGLVAAIHIAGEAGAWHGRFFDGDLVHLDALPRLHVTGALDGAAGASRLRGLGGGVVLGSLTAAFDDWRCAHVVDRGLGLGLTLALLFVIVERAPMRLLTLFALVALTSATPELGPDLASRWSIVALILACYVSLTRATARQALPWDTLLLATAIATVTHAGVGAVVVAIGVLARRAPPGPSRRRALRRAALVVVAGAGGLVVSAITAPMLEPQWPAPANVVLWPIVAMVGHALLTLATRSLADPALQRTFTAACAMLASLGLMPTVGAAAAGALVLTIPVACLMGARLLPHHQTPGGGLIMLAMVAALATTRFPVGAPPLSWEARLVRLIDNARALSQKAIPAGGDPGHLVRQSPSQPRH
ncbi:MAG TPA: hypothetical protein VM734_04905 [Kofleriaceae bacterium]|nr:hypothetical protein [Kofleriaceae bacterium]